jgi:hypothetical protein
MSTLGIIRVREESKAPKAPFVPKGKKKKRTTTTTWEEEEKRESLTWAH